MGFESPINLNEFRKNKVNEKELPGYADRISSGAQEIAADKIMSEGSFEGAKEDLAEKIKEISENLIKASLTTWEEKLSKAEDPDKAEDDLTQGFATKLKDEYNKSLIEFKKAA